MTPAPSVASHLRRAWPYAALIGVAVLGFGIVRVVVGTGTSFRQERWRLVLESLFWFAVAMYVLGLIVLLVRSRNLAGLGAVLVWLVLGAAIAVGARLLNWVG